MRTVAIIYHGKCRIESTNIHACIHTYIPKVLIHIKWEVKSEDEDEDEDEMVALASSQCENK